MTSGADIRSKLLVFQKNEITEYHIYGRLAAGAKNPENRKILEEIADQELRHYKVWRKYTLQDVDPDQWAIRKYYWIGRLLGFTFSLRLMERGEENAQDDYEQLRYIVPEAELVIIEENQHEDALLRMLDEEKLRYTGSVILGLNDALVELTGALAGLTLALQNTKLIALTGSIIGIAAALSMGASEYLSTKTEDTRKNPLLASFYTGGAYIGAVILLILPFLILRNCYLSLGFALAASLSIIALFNLYISVVKDQPFKRHFLEMAGLSLGVASLSFLIGFLMRAFLGVDI
ncbi:MAG: VIT1/CCC1 transporter family protein [Syntrophales bacterium]|nr:VIT1/CCC1 transporter family protein [Syntrophales bacterium]MDD5531776.1 VIT1/CCC1 transporter family protein [Syntrophales bacterium]